ncbi:hypothetical protein LUZ63_008786 [Rhynchospora breviuscula]|uniref:Pectinesterase n=1 Tax=Rhynchospora breviuscula TaxID=2022672 RepID=A0A9Q0CDW0_9POAL|nr:hypothetical protein LUZ63_008786 [Rhynchospora breviuscula]
MARTLILSLHLISISLLFAPSFADPSSPIPPSVACRSTPYPQFCKSILPGTQNSSHSLYDYGLFCILRSLSNAQKFYEVIQRYLTNTNNGSLSPAAMSALEDCVLLSGLNLEYLNSAIKGLNNTNSTLLDPNADTLQTLLSALLTNLQTCTDGLVANNITIPSISDCTKLYSVSLALYTNAWNPGGMRHLFHNGSVSPGVLNNPNLKSIRPGGRRLLQTVMVYDIVVVDQNGGSNSNYNTIAAAVAAAPKYLDGTKGYFLIYVMAGVYNEYISIAPSQSYLMIVGDGIGQTVITGNRNAGPTWSTFSSATFAVGGQGFVGIGLTIQNTAGAINGQAVALRNTADLSVFYQCSIEGYQDTLYAHSMRQFYRDCNIYGTVDFIFGNAAAVFQHCNIYAQVPLRGQGNTITAQSRSDPNQNTGFSFQGCQFKAGPDLAAIGNVVPTFLGRPWMLYSRVVVMQSFLDSLINPAGWSIWYGTYGLGTLYYAEYANWGPGSWTGNRVTWPGYHLISSNDASNFTVSAFIIGDIWLWQTGVPYNSGFL